MNTELTEQIAFIAAIPAFEPLPKSALGDLVACFSISYLRHQETCETTLVQEQPVMLIIKKGVIAQHNNNQVIAKYSDGDVIVIDSMALASELEVEEDALVYLANIQKLQLQLKDYPEILAHWLKAPEQRIHDSLISQQLSEVERSPLNNMTVQDFAKCPVATIEQNESIQNAAIKMTELGYSSLVVVDSTTHLGIVTDKDIRARCVALALDPQLPIRNIMTEKMATIEADQIAFDALLTMIDKGIHHLPVTKNNDLYGMLTLTDLMHKEGQNAAHLTSAIRKAGSTNELAQIAQLLPQLQINLTKLGISAAPIAKSITALSKAITVRLIQLGEMELSHLDQPSVPFAWLCAGSQARGEQLAFSDQDNALIYGDGATDSDKHYFATLADWVCDGLNDCGFVYCPGDIMASNAKWCQSESKWQGYFNQWVSTPSPQALLNSSVFFDLKAIYGEKQLLKNIKNKVLSATKKNTLFIAHLSRNAIANKPPLGFFRDFVLIPSGENKSTMDLKHNAIAPIVDLARIYALALGLPNNSTLERLKLASGTSILSKPAGRSLIAAYEFLIQLRIELNAQQIQDNKKPSNFLSPKDISRLQRSYLKDAFKVIKDLQDARQVVY